MKITYSFWFICQTSNIEKEKAEFAIMIEKINLKAIKSTILFWNNNKNRFPYLSKLALRLLNIAASSAFIERFFSICGVISKKRCGNMGPDLTIMRSLLKCNLHLLENNS